MGILEIAIAALSVMGGISVGSAVAGGAMGSSRKIGAFRGFPLGLFLPVVGVGRVWISDKIVNHNNAVRTQINNNVNKIAADAARKQYERDNPKRQHDRQVRVQANENANIQEQNISRSRRR